MTETSNASSDNLENSSPRIVPDPPFVLREGGFKFWRVLYFQLIGEGKLKPVDDYLLARYCTTLAEWEELDEYSRTHELFEEMTSSKGVKYFAKHPKISRLETLEPLLLRMEKQLGIGAGARAAKKIDPGEDPDVSGIFSRRKKGA